MPARSGGLRQLFSRIGPGRPASDRAHCANCGITIDGGDEEPSGGSPQADGTQVFCCDGCADGGPCVC